MTLAIVFLLQFFLTGPLCFDCDMHVMLFSDARRATFGVLSLAVQISGGLICPRIEHSDEKVQDGVESRQISPSCKKSKVMQNNFKIYAIPTFLAGSWQKINRIKLVRVHFTSILITMVII